jgi:hypothetical protein
MSTDRDVTRIVRSWLEEGVTALPDRVLDNVLDQLPSTRQRRPLWQARRFADMNNIAKLAIAAAAVVVIAVVGINLLPASGEVGGSGPAVSPTPSPSPTPPPSPSPTPAAAFPPARELAIGRHSMTLAGVPLSLSVPTPGWVSNGLWGIGKSAEVGPDGAEFILWPDEAPVGVFADPCSREKAPPIGPSAADLAAAVAALPRTDLVSGPSDVTVGGYPAKHVVLTFGEEADCNVDGRLSADEFYLWYAPSESDARYASELGSTIRVWIVDVDGAIVWIDGETYKGAGPEPGKEIQQIVDSIQFE